MFKHPRAVVPAGLAAAALLITGGAAQAGPDGGSGKETTSVTAEAGTHTATAARKPLRAERRSDVAALQCWTTVYQPGGSGTTIYVVYENCGATAAYLTPASSAANGSGTFTYVGWCQPVGPGEAWQWTITPDWFPPTPTHGYTLTNCL